MKNIQVIDGADNCVYDIYAVSDEDFKIMFPNGNQNIEFIEDLELRVGTEMVKNLNTRIWQNRIPKSEVNGIHGTLFYQLLSKKQYYSNKIDPDN
ncbi:MAG: hypothetical protein ACMZ7B_03685 [Balneola sp.]